MQKVMRVFRIVPFVTLLLAASPAEAQYRNYSLRCLAPLLSGLDPDAPENLQEAFLSGPKYFAVPKAGIGAETIDFPVSTSSAEAQRHFNQGIALLHLLSYKEAERAFRTVVHLDPDCPMGYWGLAQANERRPAVARIYAQEARDRCDKTRPEIEQQWTALLAGFYDELESRDLAGRSALRIRDLEEMLFTFPQHKEIRAFLIRRITLDHYMAGVPVSSRFAVDSLAKDFAETAPAHPSRHYRVFLWLDRYPELITAEAQEMIALSPSAAELWRYAAEAFFMAGKTKEAAFFAKGAIQTDLRTLASQGMMPWESQNLADNYATLVRMLTDSGRIDEALSVADAVLELPRQQAEFHSSLRALRVIPLMISGQWNRLAEDLDHHPALVTARFPVERIQLLQWKTIASLATENRNGADDLITEMLRIRDEALATELPQGRKVKITELVQSTQKIRSLFRPDSQPPADFGKVALHPIVRAHLLQLSGHPGAAFREMEAERENAPYRWLPTALHCRIALESGQIREALFHFDNQFRTDASCADATLPVLPALHPIVRKLQLPDDWELPSPPLSTQPGRVGPDTWQSPAAPVFTLPDRRGNPVSLKQYAGKPVLLNFFLGTGCAFCLEQFDTFQPFYEEFEKAGIQIIAISLDTPELLGRTLGKTEQKKPGFRARFPFPVLADPELKTFRDYRVFDDFENGPMHGTILISPDGQILWRDISHSPFTRPGDLVHEARRLLQLENAIR